MACVGEKNRIVPVAILSPLKAQSNGIDERNEIKFTFKIIKDTKLIQRPAYGHG